MGSLGIPNRNGSRGERSSAVGPVASAVPRAAGAFGDLVRVLLIDGTGPVRTPALGVDGVGSVWY